MAVTPAANPLDDIAAGAGVHDSWTPDRAPRARGTREDTRCERTRGAPHARAPRAPDAAQRAAVRCRAGALALPVPDTPAKHPRCQARRGPGSAPRHFMPRRVRGMRLHRPRVGWAKRSVPTEPIIALAQAMRPVGRRLRALPTLPTQALSWPRSVAAIHVLPGSCARTQRSGPGFLIPGPRIALRASGERERRCCVIAYAARRMH